MNIYILCGLPGSGKSTWSKNNYKEKNAIILSNDYFRTMLTGYYLFDESYEKFIHKCMKECLKTAVNDKFNVIYDEVNLTRNDRADLISFIRNIDSANKIICVWLQENKNNVDRRMNDSRGVSKQRWVEIITEMSNKFDEPSLEEGFDEITIVM